MEYLHACRDTASKSSSQDPDRYDDELARLRDLCRLEAEVRKGLHHRISPLPQAIVALIEPLIGHACKIVQLRVWLEVVKPGVCVASIKGLVPSANPLRVLLRHRLLRQAHGFEGFGVIPEELHEGDL